MVEFRKPNFGSSDSDDSIVDESVVVSDDNDVESSGKDSIVDSSSVSPVKKFKFRPIKFDDVSPVDDSAEKSSTSVSGKDSSVDSLLNDSVKDAVVVSDSAGVVSDSFNPFVDEEDDLSESSSVDSNSVDDSVEDFSDGVDDSFDSFDDEFFDEFVGEDDESVSYGDSVSSSVSNSSSGSSDFIIDVNAISRGIQDRESFVDDSEDDESETFVGFDNVSTESVDKSSGVTVSDSVSDSFNPFVDEDDEGDVYVGGGSVGVSDRVSANDSDSVNTVDADSSEASSVESVRDSVVSGAEFKSLVSDGDSERLGSFYETIVDSRERSKKRGAASKKKKQGKRGPRAIDSDFKRKPVREVVVDDSGRVVSGSSDSVVDSVDNVSEGFESVAKDSLTIVDKGVKKGVSGSRERYRYLSNDGRVNVAELEFFKNLGGSKSSVLSDDSLVSSLRSNSDGLGESEAERKARVVLYEQALRGADGLKRGSRSSFNAKDRETLQFLAMFRYATDAQLARMFSCSVQTSYNRLKKLRSVGLVIDRKIYGARPIWFLTEAGLLLSGFDLPRVTESKLTFSMFPHQFTVNNTAANLWGANVNVLNLPEFPVRNRVDGKGEMVFGEKLVSELEIQSAFGKIKMFDKSDVYRPELLAEIEKQFRSWERAGGVDFGPSPEQVLGNEYMWALMPPFNIRLAYHVPDLVVVRPRNEDGTPESIAVEIEINNKASGSYEKTLRAYRADNRLYKKVIWVCKNIGPARKLEQISKEIGLWQDGRIDIVPVITEDGVFKERDLWMI